MKRTVIMIVIALLSPLVLMAQVIYVVNSQSRTLSRIDIEENTVQNGFAHLGAVPNKVILSDEYLFVVNSGDNAIQKISAQTGSTVANHLVAVGCNPWDAILHDGYLYISGLFSFQVYKMNPETGQVVGSVSVGVAPEAMAVANGKLYVCNAGNYAQNYAGSSVSVIDLDSFSLIQSIPTVANPQFIQLHDGKLHVSCTGNWTDIAGAICVIDTQSDEIVYTIPIGGTPGNIWISSDGIAYVADNSGYSLYSYDAEDYSLLNPASDPLPFAASDLTGDANLIALLNPNWGDNAIVQVLNLDFNNLRNYSTGLMPTDIKLQPGSSSNADPAQIQIPAIAVYPSPLRRGHSLNLKSLDNQRGEFKLFNLRGQMLHSVQLQPAEQISLDIKLNNGIYFYRFQSGTASTTGKLTVIR